MTQLEVHSFGIIPLSQQEGEWKIFLILHKEGNHWGFPKGRANPGETPLQSATRELKEETGLDVVRYLQETPLVEVYQFQNRSQRISKHVYYFPALVTGELLLQQEEIRDGRWLSFEEALKLLTFKEGRSICTQLMSILKIQPV
jgi:8-oxo-dGTP pyrophosphatase MutT (NUDIX family)